MTTQPTRDQLRALADAATEGPWMHDRDQNDGWMVVFGGNERPHGYNIIVSDEYLTPEDAAFIAAARNATPHYLNQLDQADARIEAVIELHKPVMTYRLIDGEDFAQEPDAHVCMECRELYPCPTIQALDAAQQD